MAVVEKAKAIRIKVKVKRKVVFVKSKSIINITKECLITVFFFFFLARPRCKPLKLKKVDGKPKDLRGFLL